jgi:hypothetical protein
MLRNILSQTSAPSDMPLNWPEMAPAEKRQWRLDKFLNAEGVKFISQAAEKAYRMRAKRLVDVYNVSMPDRVPFNLPLGNIAYNLSGLDMRSAMYDYDRVVQACKAFNSQYSAELEAFASPFVYQGKVMEILDYKLYVWPGHGLASDATGIQFVEGEYMKPEEYDALIDDPSDFWTRTYLPRIFGAFQPFGMFRPVTDMVEIVNIGQFMPFSTPAMQETLRKLLEVGQEYQRMIKALAGFGDSGIANGFPVTYGAFCKAPFDIIGDSLRGTQGIMKDMYRRPEKLLEALDVVANFTIRSILTSPSISRIFMVTYPLHKGADGWMSQKQFETFYWPSLKKVMSAFIREGLIQSMFAEGSFNTRLETVNEFPKGAVSWYFDQSDMQLAKKVLGQKCCIQGNVPTSLVITGDPKDVKAYCRKLIETCGQGGGYILSAGAVAENPKLDNLKAMVEAVKEYGVYKK